MDAQTGAPTDELIPSVQQWLASLGCPAQTVKQVLEAGPDKRLMDVLMQAIERVNSKATSNAQTIKKISLLPADFSIPTGELGEYGLF